MLAHDNLRWAPWVRPPVRPSARPPVRLPARTSPPPPPPPEARCRRSSCCSSAPTEARIADLDGAAAAAVPGLAADLSANGWQRAGRLAGTHGRPSPWLAEDATYDEVLTRGLSNGVLLGGFDAALSLTIPDGAPVDGHVAGAVAALRERLGDTLDADRSAVALGTAHSIKDGHGPIQLFYGMRRKAGVTHEAFSEYWLQQHSKVGVVTPGLAGYHQLHADQERSAAATTAAGFGVEVLDGVALEWFADMAAFVSAVGSRPDHGVAAKASEDRFNDISRATGILARVLDVGGAAS